MDEKEELATEITTWKDKQESRANDRECSKKWEEMGGWWHL